MTRIALLVLATLLVVTAPACRASEPAEAPAEPSGRGATALPDVAEIDGDPVVALLPPDAIPAIDAPRFVTADEASFMDDDEPVVGVVHEEVAKAYSLWHLDRHEVVNDVFADEPLAVTW